MLHAYNQRRGGAGKPKKATQIAAADKLLATRNTMTRSDTTSAPGNATPA